MWQGIEAVTDCKINDNPSINGNLCLAEELNMFFTRFDRENKSNGTVWPALLLDQHQSLILDTDDVRRVLYSVNVRKVAGPDGIPGRVLRECADKLSGVYQNL